MLQNRSLLDETANPSNLQGIEVVPSPSALEKEMKKDNSNMQWVRDKHKNDTTLEQQEEAVPGDNEGTD